MDFLEMRKQTGLTQRRFSEFLGIPLSTYRNWEQGLRTPPDHEKNLIERFLCDKYLIGHTENLYGFLRDSHPICKEFRVPLRWVDHDGEIGVSYVYMEKVYFSRVGGVGDFPSRLSMYERGACHIAEMTIRMDILFDEGRKRNGYNTVLSEA